jgi:hypothetical protein
MAEKKFSNKEAIVFGWQVMKYNFGFFAGLLIVYFAVVFLASMLSESAMKMDAVFGLVFQIAYTVLSFIMGIGMIKIALMFCDGEKPGIPDLFSHYKYFFKYLLGTIIYSLLESHYKKAKTQRRRLSGSNRMAFFQKTRYIFSREIYEQAKTGYFLAQRTFSGRGGVSRG